MLHWSDKIKKEFYHPKNIGELDLNDPQVYVASHETPDGFTRMQLHLKISNKTILDAKYKVLGCPCCIACLSFLTANIIGKHINELQNFDARYLIKGLELPKERYSSALMVEMLLEEIKNKCRLG